MSIHEGQQQKADEGLVDLVIQYDSYKNPRYGGFVHIPLARDYTRKYKT